MTPLAIGYIGVAVLVLILFSGMPVGVIMGLIGFFGVSYATGWEPGLNVLQGVPYTAFADYGLSVIPLFILMGSFCFYAGISKDLYDTVHAWLGHLPGGLAVATIGACAGFAAVSGSSVAEAATMSTVALPEMKRYSYDSALATGAVAAGGTLGILIPPSVIMIIYGILTEQSIGKLFLAGFIPGILLATFYMAAIYIVCKRNPLLGLPGPRTSFRQKILALKGSWMVFLLFILVIGGIYAGVFSPTEAAGVGACGAFIFALARRRLTWRNLRDSLFETSSTTAMTFVVLIGALIFGYFLALTRLPFHLASVIGGLAMNRYIILGGIIALYIFLGCIIPDLPMIMLTVPIFFPVVKTLGFDPIWFGIIITLMCEIGQITPPVGINVFIIYGVAKDVSMETIFRGIYPFFVADLVIVALVVAFPQIALFLPGLMH